MSSMFAKYKTANSPISKQLLRVTSKRIAGDRLLQNQTWQKKRFFEAGRVSRETTVYGRGSVGNFQLGFATRALPRKQGNGFKVLRDTEGF